MRRILFMNCMLMLFLISEVCAQSQTVTGKVTDAVSNQGLPGVTVLVKGTSNGTATDVNGNYSLSASPSGVLTFSFIGYTTVERPIGNATNIDVTLNVDAAQLQEVLIQVPYGTVAKTAFTGSEATITSAAIQKQQVTSVTRALEGLIPGLQTTNGSGSPGSSADVRIRGIGSVNASSSPLYVVDGIPFDGTLSSISPDDIESITVLKDAAASALYGSRAANGVIMIATKRGKKGKPTVAINLRSGVSSRAIPEYDRVNPQEFYELTWEALRNANLRAVNPASTATPKANYTPEEAAQFATNTVAGPNGLVYNPYNVSGNQVIDPTTGKLNPNAQLLYQDDWADVLFQKATRNDLNLNISGANENNDYLLSVGYIDEQGIAKFSDYERMSARVKANTTVNKWLKAGVNISGALSNSNGSFATGTATSNPFYYSRYMGPIYPVWQRDGSGNFVLDPNTNERMLDWGVATQMGARPYAANSNLLGSLDLDDRGGKRIDATANTFAEISFLKDFTFRTTIGGSFYNNLGTTFQNSLFGDAANVTGRSTKADTRQTSYTFNQVLSWNKKFGLHGLSALAGHENYALEYNFMNATRTGFPFPGTNELASAATLSGATSYTNEHKIESYFSQVSYDFQEKYLLSASYRTDGSSRFYKDSRWGSFWSLGTGWRISEESFLDGASWINELKFKASYGQQGNENILEDVLNNDLDPDYYAWQGLYSLGFNNVNAPGALFSSFPVLDLQWEKNATLNVGADFRLFNKLDGTIEWYNRVSDNLLFDVPLAPSVGVTSIPQNIGTMKNTGVELQLGYNVVTAADFDYRIDLNLARNRNEITKLPQEEIVRGTNKLMVGHDIYDFWLREYAGVNPDNGDALYYKDIKDANDEVTGRETTNDIRQATYYYHGSAIPDLVGGITNSLRFKGFDLSVLVTGQLGGLFYDENYQGLMHRGTLGQTWSTDMLNRWQKPGDMTNVPRLQRGVANQDGASSRWLFDASYLTIKNINLGYTIPKTLTERISLGSVRAFVAADNTFIFTKNKGMDPQRSFNGRSDYSYPIYRTLTLGLNANF